MEGLRAVIAQRSAALESNRQEATHVAASLRIAVSGEWNEAAAAQFWVRVGRHKYCGQDVAWPRAGEYFLALYAWTLQLQLAFRRDACAYELIAGAGGASDLAKLCAGSRRIWTRRDARPIDENRPGPRVSRWIARPRASLSDSFHRAIGEAQAGGSRSLQRALLNVDAAQQACEDACTMASILAAYEALDDALSVLKTLCASENRSLFDRPTRTLTQQPTFPVENSGSKPKAANKRGPKPKWTQLKDWLKTQVRANGNAQPADLREAYLREFPDAELPNQDTMRVYVSAAKRSTDTRLIGPK